ncbi:uncharacterized protein LOC134205297 [Armigeres subalbatus]|uniref:uncharacterized protein LOC134205297 n=1 Tax=Armigeres subalbatus TaxID=124917 RepID=UPI002ED5AA18
MTSRRTRFSLSLVRRSESPKSPICERSRSSNIELNTSISAGCSTPLNTRKRRSLIKCDSPVFTDNEQSPIHMSQEGNIVTGVSWAWNSPKRAIIADQRLRGKPLTSRNIVSNRHPDFYKKKTQKSIKKLTGFHKFESELKLLQEAENTPYCSAVKSVPPETLPQSPDKDDVVVVFQNAKTPLTNKTAAAASESFNDSELDNLLLQASQTVEIQSTLPMVAAKQPTMKPEKYSNNRRSLVKSKTTDNFDGNSDDSLADGELDLLLAQIEQQPKLFAEPEGESTQNANTTNTTDQLNPRTKGLLTRHKSMPESPSRKLTDPVQTSSRGCRLQYRKIVASPSSTTGSVASSDNSTAPSSTNLQPVRVCSKEEIEHKRQEALKRQACRLKRLMQGNHSQNDAQLFQSKNH